jgi:hypothetical protein
MLISTGEQLTKLLRQQRMIQLTEQLQKIDLMVKSTTDDLRRTQSGDGDAKLVTLFPEDVDYRYASPF